jgi:hypothetical protein
MNLSVTRSGDACGAEIKFDLSSELDERTFAKIEEAFHDNIVVCFRGQWLSSERHIEFSRRFGELEIHVLKKYLLPGYPEQCAEFLPIRNRGSSLVRKGLEVEIQQAMDVLQVGIGRLCPFEYLVNVERGPPYVSQRFSLRAA